MLQEEAAQNNKLKMNEKIQVTVAQKQVHCYWMNSDDSIWKPEARANHTLSLINGIAYLIGGLGTRVHNQIIALSLGRMKWVPILQTRFQINESNTKITPIPSRCNHTAVVFNQDIIIFGGEDEFDINTKQKYISRDTIVYNPQRNVWRFLICKGDDIAARRNHAAVMVGKQMVVFGGINQQQEFLCDFLVLDIITQKWFDYSKSFVLDELPFRSGVAYHQVCAVFEDPAHTLFQQQKQAAQSLIGFIKEEGIYLFGGQVSETEYLKGIYILKSTYPVSQWRLMQTQGKLPKRRAHHQMLLMPNIGSIVISGGRNDLKNKTRFFNDLHLLNLKTLNWI